MKKNRVIRILALAIALVAIIGAAFAVSAGAEDAATPEIVSKNVAYQGNFALMYAVDASTATAPVSLYLYYEEPTEESVAAKKYTVNETTAPADSGLDFDAYIFRTEGVAAKDMADVFYVQVIDADGDASRVVRCSVGEYLYERLATPGITEVQENLYYQTLYFGAAAQAVLDPTSAPVTEYRYAYVEGGTLADGYSAGIYPIGTSLTPYAAGAKGWTVTSYADDKTATQQVIGAGESFTLEGVTVVTPITKEPGTLDFEGSTEVPEEVSGSIGSSGGSVSVVSIERNGAATNALKFTTVSGGQDVLSLRPTYTVDGYNTVAFDFDVNFGAGSSSGYEIIVRDTDGNQIFRFGLGVSNGNWKINDVTNTSSGYNFWSKEFVATGDWTNVRIEITPDAYTRQMVLAIYLGGQAVAMGVSDKNYHTYNNVFLTADKIGRLDFRSSTDTANDMYFDNLRVERIATDARPHGTDGLEGGKYPSNISLKVSELTTDTVYGNSSTVLHLKPDSDGSMDTYNVSANNTAVPASSATGLAFAADLKFSKGESGDNIAYDFMLDGYIDDATSTAAVYWLRFISSNGRVYIQNQKNTSEKYEIAGLDEYFYFQAAYVTLEDGSSAVHILVNGSYVGSFVTQQNAGSCPVTKLSNLRIRTMSNYDYHAYLDNIFVGYCYAE